jgi:hypothetical protein
MPLVLAWLRFNGREGQNGVHAEGRPCILATMMTVEETSSLYDEVRSVHPLCCEPSFVVLHAHTYMFLLCGGELVVHLDSFLFSPCS